MKFQYRYVLVFFLALALYLDVKGQIVSCNTLGQNPTTAYPVCGIQVFEQKTVPLCGGNPVPTPCTDGAGYSDINPYWYKFTCYTSGKLGFTITPISKTDDYDWELFDITGHDPMEIYTNKSLIVSANWSGMLGPTGASALGSKWYECASTVINGNPTFSTMPDLIATHNYILLVSNYYKSQIGYHLSFQGGTASIIDPVTPILTKVHAICDGSQILLMLNKKMKCSSVSKDGSDFNLTGLTSNNIVNAVGLGCATSFDTDTLLFTLQNNLTPGNYLITSKIGNNNQRLIDYCDNQLPVGLTENLIFTYALPTQLDSIVPVICIQDTLKLVFKRPMKCNSIANDGSDFFITGPTPVKIKSANGVCSSGLSDIIQIVLDSPIKINGNYQLHLTTGTDGNSIINECGIPTAVGSTINFSINNISTADFTYQIGIGCKYDTLSLSHNGNNGANSWNWTLANGSNSLLQNPVLITKDLGIKKTKLTVSNGYCSDSSSILIDLIDHRANATFIIADTICLKDSLTIVDKSSSNIINSYWDFGNGITSQLLQPINIFYETVGQNNKYIVRHIVENSFNCYDTSYKTLLVLPICYIDVPTGFTPNGDGLNDYLYPLNAFKARNLSFKVYNRYGQIIYESNDWHEKWDGRLNGELQPSGTYVWTLDYTNRDTGKVFHLKGTTVLIR